MLNGIIRFSLKQRPLVIAAALLLVVYGMWQTQRTKIEVFPDLNRPLPANLSVSVEQASNHLLSH